MQTVVTGTRRLPESAGDWHGQIADIAALRFSNSLASAIWRDIPPSGVEFIAAYLRRIHLSGSDTFDTVSTEWSPTTSGGLPISRIIELVGGGPVNSLFAVASPVASPELYESAPELVPQEWINELEQYRGGAECDLPWAED